MKQQSTDVIIGIACAVTTLVLVYTGMYDNWNPFWMWLALPVNMVGCVYMAKAGGRY